MAEGEETEQRAAINHELAARREVLIREIAWFKKLDMETVELIADTAPLHSPEYEYATAELRRRAVTRSVRSAARRTAL